MIVLTHRGYWKTREEQNRSPAFIRSFAAGLGTETDLRDCGGKIVIAHNPAMGDELSWHAFTELLSQAPTPLNLALNIKADGLAEQLSQLTATWSPHRAFFFDMSIPDMLHYLRLKLPVFGRQSEIEREVVCYEQLAGVWMDSFYNDWIEAKDVARHLDAGKQVCLVSSELHRRDPRPFWDRISNWGDGILKHDGMMICTDLPEEAAAAFDSVR